MLDESVENKMESFGFQATKHSCPCLKGVVLILGDSVYYESLILWPNNSGELFDA